VAGLTVAVGGVVLLSVLLVVGSVLTGVLDDGPVGEADRAVASWLAERRTPTVDAVAALGTALSDTWTVIGAGAGACTMLLAAGHARRAGVVAAALALDMAVFLTVAAVVDRPRPDVVRPEDVVLPPTASFPSGHAAVAVVLYGVLTLVAASLTGDRRVRSTGWVLTAAVAALASFARLHQGLHFPSDVVAGLALGAGVLAVVARAHRASPPERGGGGRAVRRHHRQPG
jgi:membrane-associated phospholipid phosphatase